MTIVIDLDGVVYDTIRTIVNLYNYDHLYYKDFEPVLASNVKTWDFDELNLEPREYIDKYFNMPRFFAEVKLMIGAKWIIDKLHYMGFKIVFCSSGSFPNLQLKREWINKHFEYADFIPVDLERFKDKASVNMRNCWFIDDVSKNLETSNAKHKICFGEVYPWNEDWKGIRCKNWIEIYQYIRKEVDNIEGTI